MFVFYESSIPTVLWHCDENTKTSIVPLSKRGVCMPLVSPLIAPTFYYKTSVGDFRPFIIPNSTVDIKTIPGYDSIYAICQGPMTNLNVKTATPYGPTNAENVANINLTYTNLQTNSWSSATNNICYNSTTNIKLSTRPFGQCVYRKVVTTSPSNPYSQYVMQCKGPSIYGPGIEEDTHVISGSVINYTDISPNIPMIQWILDKPIDMTKVNMSWIYTINASNTGIAPIDTYRINHLSCTEYDYEDTLTMFTVPLVQAGGFVHDTVNKEYTSFKGIMDKYVKRNVNIKPINKSILTTRRNKLK